MQDESQQTSNRSTTTQSFIDASPPSAVATPSPPMTGLPPFSTLNLTSPFLQNTTLSNVTYTTINATVVTPLPPQTTVPEASVPAAPPQTPVVSLGPVIASPLSHSSQVISLATTQAPASKIEPPADFTLHTSATDETITPLTSVAQTPTTAIESLGGATSSLSTVGFATFHSPVTMITPARPTMPTTPIPEHSSTPVAGPSIQTISAGGNTYVVTPEAPSQYIIDQQTLTSGGSITVKNVQISLPTQGASIVIGSSTFALLPTPLQTSPPVTAAPTTPSFGGSISVAGSPIPYQSSGSALIFGGSTTLTPGGTVTIANTPLALPASGSSIIIGSSTLTLTPSPLVTPPPTKAGAIAIQGQTLTPGGVITISGTTISYPASGSAIVLGGSSTVLFGPAETISIGSEALVISEAGISSDLVIDGHTVAPGSQTVIIGVTISVPTQATDVIIDTTSTLGLGGAILAGLGISPSPTSGVQNGSTTPITFTNASFSLAEGLSLKVCWLVVGITAGASLLMRWI